MPEYTIRTNVGIRTVEGWPISLQYGVQAFVHQKRDWPEGYGVSELKTGMAIASSGTEEEAVKEARAILRRNGRDSVLKVIEESKDRHGTVEHPRR